MSADTILCACGCGAVISRKGANGKPRRFLKGHQTKNRQVVKDSVYWEKRLQKLHDRAHLCKCGCGEPVLVSMDWLKNQSGQRNIWLPDYKEGHMIFIPCGCGCGEMIPSVDGRNKARHYVPSHSYKAAKRHGPIARDWGLLARSWNNECHKCACGCGSILVRTAEQLKNHNPIPKYISGHSNRRGCVTKLTDFEKFVILGTLLGDSSISIPSKPNGSPRLSFNHCEAQKKYAQYKMDVLHRLCWHSNTFVSSGYKKNGVMINGSSSCMPVLHNIWNIVRPGGGKKRVSLNWLSLLNDISLAFWFMDDGSTCFYKNEVSHIALHTEGFSDDENELVADWFHQYGYPKVRVASSSVYKYLYFPKHDAVKFLNQVKPYVHHTMNYKLKVV